MKISSNKGVTLISLVVIIIVMTIMSSMLYGTINVLLLKNIDNLYNDIELLNSKISEYYLKYGELPIFEETIYSDKETLIELLTTNGAVTSEESLVNVNDDDSYYVINMSKLDNLTLNYGEDYTKWTENKNQDYTASEDVYIINKTTHQVYYPKGVKRGNEMYYARDIDQNQINPINTNVISDSALNVVAKDISDIDLFVHEDFLEIESGTTCKIKINFTLNTAIFENNSVSLANLEYAWSTEENIEDGELNYTEFSLDENDTAIIESKEFAKGEYYLYIKITDNYGNKYVKRTNKMQIYEYFYTPLATETSTNNYAGVLYAVYKSQDFNYDEEREEDNTSTSIELTTQGIQNSYLKNNPRIKKVMQGDVPLTQEMTYVTGTKNTGLVVSIDGNEFVWVPVPNAVYNEELNKEPQNACFTKEDNYLSTDAHEPIYLSEGSDAQEYNQELDGSEIVTQNGLQNEYNAMVESVKKYKGFYIARYELGLEGAENNPVSKNAYINSNVTTADRTNSATYMWYGLYKKCKSMYQVSNTSSNVVSSMVWGSQYDAMLNWLVWTGKNISGFIWEKANRTYVTGAYELDQTNKIYDLYGVHHIDTLQAYGYSVRVCRRWKY